MTSFPASTRAICVLLFLIMALSVPFQATGQSSHPQTISFQGFLTDPGGAALTDTLEIVFTLYDSTSTSVWTETHPAVAVIDGVFLVRLGSVASFQLFWNQPYELGVAVAGDPEMTPRTPLDSAPYLLSDICPAPMIVCASNCVELATDENNCGSCGNACVIGATCNTGVCACGSGEVACPSGCADLATDVNNCGSCGTQCQIAEICNFGACQPG